MDWSTIGRNIIQGIANGLSNAGHMLWDAVKGVLGNFKDKVLEFFGIRSPARWGVYVGQMIDAGFVKGIIGNIPMIDSAVLKLQDAATSPFTNASLNYDIKGTAFASRDADKETVNRLDVLIALLRAILNGRDGGDFSERELIRALRDLGVVNDTLEANEHITIDSRKKTIIKRLANGTEQNIFYKKATGNSIFTEIPPGDVLVSWNGEFGFDILAFKERSVPEWIS